MKFICFEQHSEHHWGLVDDSVMYSLGRYDPARPQSINELIGQLQRQGVDRRSMIPAADDARLLPPVPAPGKVICIGRNYAGHAAEMGSAIDDLPVVFNKFASAIIGPGQPVRLPEMSQAVDYEAELVVVIGKTGFEIPRTDVSEYVFGYCCGNDVTARDWQKGRPGGQWLLGKSFDSFAPIGPWIVSGEALDAGQLEIQMRLNGQIRQASNTCHLIFSIDYLIAHISRFCTLQPGDLLFTGTPEGVGAGRQPPVFLKPGDHMEVDIAGIGCLSNPVVAGRDDSQPNSHQCSRYCG